VGRRGMVLGSGPVTFWGLGTFRTSPAGAHEGVWGLWSGFGGGGQANRFDALVGMCDLILTSPATAPNELGLAAVGAAGGGVGWKGAGTGSGRGTGAATGAGGGVLEAAGLNGVGFDPQ